MHFSPGIINRIYLGFFVGITVVKIFLPVPETYSVIHRIISAVHRYSGFQQQIVRKLRLEFAESIFRLTHYIWRKYTPQILLSHGIIVSAGLRPLSHCCLFVQH